MLANLVPQELDNAANPLQAGDPFKRKNFNRFALGMCLIIALFLIAAIAFFFFGRNHSPTPTPTRQSSRGVRVVGGMEA